MIGLFTFAAVAGSAAICGSPAPVGPVAATASVITGHDLPTGAHATLRELWEGGVAWDDFLGAATARRALWVENADAAAVPPELLDRARAVAGTWRILAVAVDACSDSVNTIPYVAELTGIVPSLDLRIIDSTAGREIMETHRTPDGRAATPTLLLLDADWNEAGCFIERPAPLQRWYAEREGTVAVRELTAQKMEWYDRDAGRSTLEEIVAMLEGAAAGSPVCAASPAGPDRS